jgi:hypothetical protein
MLTLQTTQTVTKVMWPLRVYQLIDIPLEEQELSLASGWIKASPHSPQPLFLYFTSTRSNQQQQLITNLDQHLDLYLKSTVQPSIPNS